MSIVWDASDSSEKFCLQLCKNGVVSLMVKLLKISQNDYDQSIVSKTLFSWNEVFCSFSCLFILLSQDKALRCLCCTMSPSTRHQLKWFPVPMSLNPAVAWNRLKFYLIFCLLEFNEAAIRIVKRLEYSKTLQHGEGKSWARNVALLAV